MAISEFEKTLLTAQPFKYLNRQELDVIKTYCKIVTFKKNALIYEQGKKAMGMYIILGGTVEEIGKVLGNKPLTLRTLEKGNFMGEISLIQRVPSPSTVIANEEAECLLLSSVYYDMLTFFFPEIRYKISRAIVEETILRINHSANIITNILTQTDASSMSQENNLIKSFGSQDPTSFAASRIDIQDFAKYPFMRTLSSEEIDILLNHSELIKTSIKYPLIKEGEENTPYFFIIRGAVLVSINASDKLAKIAVLSPVSLFGNISFITHTPSVINYTTCERTVLLSLAQHNLKLLEQNNKTLWFKIFSAICESFVVLENTTNKLIIRLNSEVFNR